LLVIDDFTNSIPAALERVEKLAGRPVVAYRGDMRDRQLLNEVISARIGS
jgi:UDP-glucose 4-epimerase